VPASGGRCSEEQPPIAAALVNNSATNNQRDRRRRNVISICILRRCCEMPAFDGKLRYLMTWGPVNDNRARRRIERASGSRPTRCKLCCPVWLPAAILSAYFARDRARIYG
jgi:hypothetical protein